MNDKPFVPTPDVPEWLTHKLTDESWAIWRDENPQDVAEIVRQLEAIEKHMSIEDQINEQIRAGCDTNQISDGYHTFGELYEHRITLFIALCKALQRFTIHLVWKSRKHSDGSAIEGWFVMGINQLEGNQITYHLPDSKWDETEFADELSVAPKFDGHTSADVLERLAKLIQ